MTQASKALLRQPFSVELMINAREPRDFMIRVTDEIAMNVSMLECVYLAIGNENSDEHSVEAAQSVIWNIQKTLKSLNEQINAHIKSDFKIYRAA